MNISELTRLCPNDKEEESEIIQFVYSVVTEGVVNGVIALALASLLNGTSNAAEDLSNKI